LRTHRARECCSTACECESCSAKNNRRSWRSETLGGQQLVSRRAFRTAGVTKVVLAKSSDRLKGVRRTARANVVVPLVNVKVVVPKTTDAVGGAKHLEASSLFLAVLFARPVLLKLY